MIELSTPISEEAARELQVGDTVEISGYILCGRDAVLPKVLKMIDDGTVGALGVDLHGQVIFHTAPARRNWFWKQNRTSSVHERIPMNDLIDTMKKLSQV